MNIDNYMEFLGFKNPEEVFDKVKGWSSGLSDQEHVARSTIQDIHLHLEIRLKRLLYSILKPAIVDRGDKAKYDDHCRNVQKMVEGLNFSAVYRIMRPILASTEVPKFDDIREINEVRGQVTHSGKLADVEYKGHNPIEDAEGPAHLFADAFAVNDGLAYFDSFLDLGRDYPREGLETTPSTPAFEACPR